jgi:hypothetical protein
MNSIGCAISCNARFEHQVLLLRGCLQLNRVLMNDRFLILMLSCLDRSYICQPGGLYSHALRDVNEGAEVLMPVQRPIRMLHQFLPTVMHEMVILCHPCVTLSAGSLQQKLLLVLCPCVLLDRTSEVLLSWFWPCHSSLGMQSKISSKP